MPPVPLPEHEESDDVESPSPPLPEPLVTVGGVNKFVYSDEESDDEELDWLKQKVNEEDAESSESEDNSSECDTPERDVEKLWYRPYSRGDRVIDKACWIRYFEQIHDSEGFDIKDYPGSAPMTSIFPMQGYLQQPEFMEKMKDFARRAIQHYNEKMGTSYVVNEILKVNGHVIKHFMYYITLSVKNGENEYFQVKVVDRLHLYNSLEFPIVRPRAKGGLDI
ncbi:uncharacterized protein [Solanum tuberosum]|uniref:Cystatin domain-containing protein n=1 Tax=Solanum tuberosum TaxID=4113 RepID=M1CUP3_SOLTU|nr:PREDICTED: uncharacterized protein LOC102597746 [Solanum tuberosum]